MCWVIDYPFSLLFLLFRWLVKDKWLELWTGWAKEHSTVDHLKVGRGESMRGTGKLHSTKSFRLIFFFFFFFPQHCCVVLDLRCRFYDLVLKEVVFFSGKTKKNQAIMNVFFFVAGKFESLLHTHVFSFEIYTAYKVFNPWIFHVLLLFNITKIQLDLFTHIGM